MYFKFLCQKKFEDDKLHSIGCSFANDFFCKIVAHGLLIYEKKKKMFSVNFYVSCFDIIRNSIGKKLIRLDWEEAVYQPLFKLTTS